MDLKAIILDFDGVLVESVDIKKQAFIALFQKFTEHFENISKYLEGSGPVIRFEKFRYIYEHILQKEYTQDIGDQLGQEFSDFVINRVINCPSVEGADDFLKYFHGRVPLYIVSLNPPEDLDCILKGRQMKHYFTSVHAVSSHKEKAINEVIKAENIDPSEAVFVGDSIEDYEAAGKADVPFIGRYSSFSFEDKNIPVFNDMKEVREHICATVTL